MYLEDFDVVQASAHITQIEEHEGQEVIVLDQTCFYPKGGGQDFDTGEITCDNSMFKVEAVFFVDGEVKHIGLTTRGAFSVGGEVTLGVDEERRSLNTRLHSAGHVIDMAIRSLDLDWHPVKAAHLPHQSFVDYASNTFDPEQKDTYIERIQQMVHTLVAAGSTNTIAFKTPDEMRAMGAVVQPNIPKDKPSRIMLYDDFAVPCGGTHVRDIKAIGTVTIRKIKKKSGLVRVSYAIGSYLNN